MPFQPAPQTARVEVIYTQDGQTCVNVLHYKTNADITAERLEDFCAEFVSQWTTFLRPYVVNTVNLVAVKATSLDSEFAPGVEFTTGLPLAGTGSGSPLPNNVTVAVRFLTLLRGRSYRGRAYHIGLQASAVTANQISTTLQTNLRNAWIGLQSIEATDVWAQCVLSRYQGGALRPEGVTTDVNNVQVERTIDSQRRRLPGRGA